IGRAVAIKFAENKAYVGINYNTDETGAKETLRAIKEKGSNGILLKADVSNIKEVEKMVRTFAAKTKAIDILVNNAGIYDRNKFENMSLEDWEKVISINLNGCFNLCKVALPYMKAGGKIIFISSQLALKGSSHGANYAASKAGILGLARSLALELAHKKINVNAIAPGTIDTNIIANYTKEERQKRINEIPLKRLGAPIDIANVCLFLASDLSSYITGETINVNGGLYIQ
ncbi:MAG: hypothetical protein A3K77_04670, partial [Euryarchaeota archaeon RBG_13_31_8]